MARDPVLTPGRIFALAASGVLVLVAISPVVRKPTEDGFPLSTYPMFATKRETKQTFDYPLGFTASGERRTLGSHVLETGETLQALTTVQRAVAKGKKELEPLCNRIAEVVATSHYWDDVVTIKIVTGTQDAIDYLAEGKIGPERERWHCKVNR